MKLRQQLAESPQKIFLIDSLGALLTAVMLGIVLVRLEYIFGIPSEVLKNLALLACIFSLYSLVCYLVKMKNWRIFLKAIAITNLLYCCLTVGLMFKYYDLLTIFGFLYFIIEIVIVVFLAKIELAIASTSEV